MKLPKNWPVKKFLIHRLQGAPPTGGRRRSDKVGAAQPRMKNPPEPWVLGEASISGILAILLLWSLVCQFFFVTDFDKAKTAVARWPQFSRPHLEFALALFKKGSKKSQQELALAKKALFPNAQLIQKVESIVTQPEKIVQQIDYWQSLVQKGIELPQAYLRLSLLHYQVYQDDKARESWQKAFYLDPNNKMVEEVGKIVN